MLPRTLPSSSVARVLLALLCTLSTAPAAWAQDPPPQSVTLVGSLQSELGCTGDWDPRCTATALTYDAMDGVWQGALAVPAGSYVYKVALDGSFSRTYGLRDGSDVPLVVPTAQTVKFYFDPVSHWVTDGLSAPIVVAAGDFQSELGCAGDWQPDCLRSWLQDADGDGVYTFTTRALPAGDYQLKVTLHESWDENYGTGGQLGGSNVLFTLPAPATPVRLSYDAVTHVPSVDFGPVATLTSPREGQLTWARRHTVTGTGPAGSTIVLGLDGVELARVVATGANAFSFTPATDLAEGPHRLTARAEQDGIQGPEAAVSFGVDSIEPVAAVIDAPAFDASVNDTRPVFRGRAEPLATVELRIDGVAVATLQADAQGAWSWQPPEPLREMQHSAETRTWDAAGHQGPWVTSHRFAVDLTPPLPPVIQRPTDGEAVPTATPWLQGSVESGATVQVFIDGEPAGSAVESGGWSVHALTPLSEGPHTLYAIATDRAGHRSPPTALRTFVVDLTPPAVPTLTAPTEGGLVSGTPVFRGQAEPGATVQVLLLLELGGEAPLPPATADATGAWSTQYWSSLQDGPKRALAFARDAAGNPSARSAVVSFTVDSVPPWWPEVLTPTPDSRTGDARPLFSGTAEPHARVRVLTDGRTVAFATADDQGRWSTRPTDPLQEGRHSVQAEQADTVGNVGPLSATFFITLDLTAPQAPFISSPADGSTVAARSLTLSGTAEQGSQVTVTLNGTSVGTVTANQAWAWSLQVLASLPDGTYVAQAIARDDVGNVSAGSALRTFTVDGTAPAAPVLLTPAAGSAVASARPTFSGTAEPHARLSVLVDGAEVVTGVATAAGDWSFLPTGTLGEGPHTVRVTATDRAGNTGVASATQGFTVDLTAPSIPSLTSPADGARVASHTPALSGTADAGSTVVVVVDGAVVGLALADPAGAWSFVPTAPLAEGAHTLQVEAHDVAGNHSARTGPRTLTIDVTPPAVPALDAPALVATSTVSLQGSAEPGARVTLWVDGEAAGSTLAGDTGAWSLVVLGLTDGAHSVAASAEDAAGNAGPRSASVSLTVDTLAPDTRIVSGPPASTQERQAAFVLEATEAGASLECALDGGPFAACTVSLTLDGLATGAHTLQVRARDAAGHVDASPASHTWTVVQGSSPSTPPVQPPSVEPLQPAHAGGCSTGGGAPAGLLGLGVLALLGRRRRRTRDAAVTREA